MELTALSSIPKLPSLGLPYREPTAGTAGNTFNVAQSTSAPLVLHESSKQYRQSSLASPLRNTATVLYDRGEMTMVNPVEAYLAELQTLKTVARHPYLEKYPFMEAHPYVNDEISRDFPFSRIDTGHILKPIDNPVHKETQTTTNTEYQIEVPASDLEAVLAKVKKKPQSWLRIKDVDDTPSLFIDPHLAWLEGYPQCSHVDEVACWGDWLNEEYLGVTQDEIKKPKTPLSLPEGTTKSQQETPPLVVPDKDPQIPIGPKEEALVEIPQAPLSEANIKEEPQDIQDQASPRSSSLTQKELDFLDSLSTEPQTQTQTPSLNHTELKTIDIKSEEVIYEHDDADKPFLAQESSQLELLDGISNLDEKDEQLFDSWLDGYKPDDDSPPDVELLDSLLDENESNDDADESFLDDLMKGYEPDVDVNEQLLDSWLEGYDREETEDLERKLSEETNPNEENLGILLPNLADIRTDFDELEYAGAEDGNMALAYA